MQAHTDTPAAPAKLDHRQMILSALSAFVRQRPGLDFHNYGDVTSYRSELRGITKDRHDAEALLAAVGWRTSITDKHLLEAQRAFSGRLSIKIERGAVKLNYCTGQYWPTEYRKAVCAVLAAALWDYWRVNMPAVTAWRVDSWSSLTGREYGPVMKSREEAEKLLAEKGGDKYGHVQELVSDDRLSGGDYLRRTARRELGRSIAARWFN